MPCADGSARRVLHARPREILNPKPQEDQRVCRRIVDVAGVHCIYATGAFSGVFSALLIQYKLVGLNHRAAR